MGKLTDIARVEVCTARALRSVAALLIGVVMAGIAGTRPAAALTTGAEALVASGFKALTGKRVGLITNHTGLVGKEHLADQLAKASNVKLAAILAPEHGFRGGVEAGAHVRDGVDARTGVRVLSLYGATRKPTLEMLRGIDVLVFDIQDIGARFYTYISTMGLAMQAAAAARIPFVVLDRPNPLGGDYVSGFVLDPELRSFVGQFTIPIVHGMTVAELAYMIKGERLLDGVGDVDLQVFKMEDWKRAMRWPETGRPWVPTSPNIPTFTSALVYPGIGVVGELEVSEGRGTPEPFTYFGAPWLDARRVAAKLEGLKLPGLRFETEAITPKSIAGVASKPRFEGRSFEAVRVVVTDHMRVEPLELGMHALAEVVAEAKGKRVEKLYGNPAMFNAIAGTRRLKALLDRGASGREIVGSWAAEVAGFKTRRAKYLLY